MSNGNQFLYTFIIPIMIFWLIIPIPFMLFNLTGVSVNYFDKLKEINTSTNPNVLTYLALFFMQFGLYLKMAFLWIDGLPLFFNIIQIIFRGITWFIVLLIIRG